MMCFLTSCPFLNFFSIFHCLSAAFAPYLGIQIPLLGLTVEKQLEVYPHSLKFFYSFFPFIFFICHKRKTFFFSILSSSSSLLFVKYKYPWYYDDTISSHPQKFGRGRPGVGDRSDGRESPQYPSAQSILSSALPVPKGLAGTGLECWLRF